MTNLNVCMIGTAEYAKKIGKRGTSSDITFYNLKRGAETITLIQPCRYPEKIASLFYSASLAEFGLLVVENIDHYFGEAVVMLHCCGIRRGLIIPRNNILPEQISPYLAGTLVEKYEYFLDSPADIRERLFEEVASIPTRECDDPGSVAIDHCFPVKGVGTVILGTVIDGCIHVHSKAELLPAGKETVIRSIQKHDEGSEYAVKGDRVGVALKNAVCEDASRGAVLSKDSRIAMSSSLSFYLDMVDFWKRPLKEGMVVHIGHWMQFLPARIIEVKGDERRPFVKLSLDKPLIYFAGSRAVLQYPEGGRLRVIGSCPL